MKKIIPFLLFQVSLTLVSCNNTELVDSSTSPPEISGQCAPSATVADAGNTGVAKVFSPDPMVESGDPALTPISVKLDSYLEPVQLSHLKGNGLLQGNYIEVINGIKCNNNFGAFEPKNQFVYTHRDWRFQEAMAYYFGDSYQSYLESIGYLRAGGEARSQDAMDGYLVDPVQIVAHCELNDNAYFIRGRNAVGKILEQVCLGDSVRTPGAFYGDDAIVTIHELEHATTTDNYSPVQELNQFFFDEAGALNEAISDAMGLIYTSSGATPQTNLDPRVFSRWALGTFDPKSSHLRGAHKCPIYDSKYPNCDSFPNFSMPKSENNHQTSVSYVYPDGVGWPYSTSQKGELVAKKTYLGYLSQEEIHNGGIVLVGALWDIYAALKSNHAGDEPTARKLTSQLILESVRHLPSANSAVNHSPVTFITFSGWLVSVAANLEGITPEDQTSIQQVLKARGLYDYPSISNSDWLDIGSGANVNLTSNKTPGMYVVDNPEVLTKWLNDLGIDSQLITQNLATGLNSMMDPGEIVAVWFDLQNNSDLTAAGVLVTVTSSDPDIEILDQRINVGYMTRSRLNQTQIMYEKVNGTAIVKSLNPDQSPSSIPVSNTYFGTNPNFYHSFRTAIWMRVNPDAAHGKIVNLEVEALPANGVASRALFPVRIN